MTQTPKEPPCVKEIKDFREQHKDKSYEEYVNMYKTPKEKAIERKTLIFELNSDRLTLVL